MLLPLINTFSLPPEAAQQQPRFAHFPWDMRLSAVPQINARLDVSICLADEAASPCRMSLGQH